MTLINVIWGITVVLILICGLRLYQTYQRTKEKMIGNFTKFFMLTGVAFAIFALADPLIENLFYVKLAFVIALVFFFLGLAFLVRLVLGFTYPPAAPKLFWLIVAGIVVGLIANLKYYLLTPSRISPPALAFKTGNWVVIFLAFTPLLIFIMSFVVLIISAISLVSRAGRSSDKRFRIRAFLLILAIIFYGVAGALRGIGEVLGTRVADFIFPLALILFLGATFLYVVEKKVSKNYSSP